MRRWIVAAVLVAGCQLSVPIPQGAVDEVAQEVSRVGHPAAKYIDASVVSASTGWFNQARSVDIAINYKPVLSKETRTMTVRFYVESIQPCEVRSEVLSDTGPKPVLLDNQIASPLIGGRVCQMFSPNTHATQ